MDFGQYVVTIDKPNQHVGNNPIVPVGPSDQGTVIGYFNDLEIAKMFIESARNWDVRKRAGLGRLRVCDQFALRVVFELKP